VQFDRFEADAYQVAVRTYEVMARYGHPFIEVEHLVLALFEEPGKRLEAVLNRLTVDTQAVRDRLADVLRAAPKSRPPSQTVHISAATKRLMDRAGEEAALLKSEKITALHLLLAAAADPLTEAGRILTERAVTRDRLVRAAEGIQPAASGSDPWEQAYRRLDGSLAPLPALPLPPAAEPAALPPPTLADLPRRISPIFLGLVALTLGAAVFSYMEGPLARVSLFVFVTSGWLVSLSLHEFGHAIVAFFGGDRSVVDKGYLTLDPLKYTHKFLSILFPLLLLAMGGIGLPGGAVYINQSAIRSRWMRSLTSAAGPLATAMFAALLLPPFVLRLAARDGHFTFWSGLAMLAFLQLSALFFNLLPIPGLDGFGILEPFLPERALQITYTLRRFTFLIIFVLFFNDNPLRDLFWQTLGLVIWVAGLDPELITTGLSLYRFWEP
jgi:Zn-dependent protease